MFSGFWGWFLVVLIVAAIFGAGKLPDLRKEAEEKLKLGMAALEKGKEELNKKIAEKTKKDNAAKKTVADENQTGGEEKTDGDYRFLHSICVAAGLRFRGFFVPFQREIRNLWIL